MHGYAAASQEYFPPQVYGYQKGYNPYPYNPAKARQLVKAAGAAGQQEIPFYCRTGVLPNDIQTCTAIQQQLEAIGLKVQIHTGTSTVVLPQFAGGAGGMIYINESWFSPQITALFGDFWSPDSYFKKSGVAPGASTVIRQLQEADSPKKTAKIVDSFQRSILSKNALAVPLFRDTLAYGVTNDLNWTPSPNRQFYLEDASWK